MSLILEPTSANIERVASHLRAGGVAAVPTETVYGLAAHAMDEAACRAIFTIKGRPLIDPLIVHVANLEMARTLAQFSPLAEQIAAVLWPGPLTLVLPKRPQVPDLITANRPTVALRMPAHHVMRALLDAVALPLAAPSANPFGYISPTCAQHVADSLGDRVPLILDGGPCQVGVESTIVDLTNPATPRVLRPGGLPSDELRARWPDADWAFGPPPHVRVGEDVDPTAAQEVVATATVDSKAGMGLPAPGMLDRHYSPRRPVHIFRGTPPENAGAALIITLARPTGVTAANQLWLSENGDLDEMARNLFAVLRAADERQPTAILIEWPPAEGIGLALQDRITRASAR
jgi:L-threonylcarbamoyladenylate synthase